jgi:hypothetical protein
MANNYYSLLAKVTDGWTGAVSVVVGSVFATVSPRSRTSALRVMELLVYEARRVHGASFVAYVDDAGRFRCTMSPSFQLAATGTTQARLGLTGTVTGTAVTFPNPVPSAILPAYGAKLITSVVKLDKGASLLGGGFGFNKGRGKVRGRLTLYDTLANTSTFADTFADGGTFDVGLMRTDNATNVMTVERIRIRTSRVQRWGRLGSSGSVHCSVESVSA